MAARDIRSKIVSGEISRRDLLTAGCLAASAAGIGLQARPLRAGQAAQSGQIPNIDPGYVGPQFFDKKEEQALLEVLESGSPFRYWGPGRPDKVFQFEEAFAKHMEAKFALGVTSGTAALDCAITGLGVGPGDEVIVPAYTWWSDYTCVVHAGALPVFANIDATFNLDPKDFERKITPRTKAVIAVHLLGGPCDMDPILEIARKHKIAVLEDAAQCVGGSYRGKKLGSLGNVGIYSFQINKMITSGEGGAVVTSDPMIYERAVRFHDMGVMRGVFTDRTGSAQGEMFAGENFRMNELTGAVLGAQLTKLDAMVAQMRGAAQAVYEGIQNVPGIRLRRRPDPQGDIGYCVGWEMKDEASRDRCIEELRSRKVPASTLVGSVLLPIEESVINKRTRHPDWPSFNSPQGKEIRYGPDCCRQTLEVHDRFVLVRIGAKYTQRITDYLVDAIRQVYSSIA
ncbi:MAG TPA: DegT/DnrJ/EryC1/StrS family aminotransferase [Sedimentisphaerales bacterium]|jgi:8-amino-3,8-dideoxy-alpha-D-manno-octulosonate transaminase|nr:DegT/DnrJ/EryC1/StrS family aminotransferase [Sedimentisphaerales bacterium]HNU30812.1 DegT/DnrJ/EryC1/StrS family aminotransferase [Sedimentisphaerales bacterium]